MCSRTQRLLLATAACLACLLPCLVLGEGKELDLNKLSDTGVPLKAGYRDHKKYASPRCCVGAGCKSSITGSHAFVTTVRTSSYVPALKQLVCSLAESNPGDLLIVMGCEGDKLTKEDKQAIQDMSTANLTVEYRVVPDIKLQNDFNPRFGLNWVKLNSWMMTEFDTVINLDTDMVVVGDLTHLRGLPTDFAWVPLQAPDVKHNRGWWYNKGGFVFLRPCKAVYDHMVTLVTENEHLQFKDIHAEQTFLEWYFHYTGFRLPIIYNTNTDKGLVNKGGKLLTPGGAAPIVLHFANRKPWELPTDDKLYKLANRCDKGSA